MAIGGTLVINTGYPDNMVARALRILLAVLLLVAGARAEDRGELTEDEQALFRWWDGLGYPDVVSSRFVKVGTLVRGYEERSFDHTFLLADEPATFRVFTTDLHTEDFAREGDVKWVVQRGFEAADLERFVTEGSRAMRAPGPISWFEDPPDPFGIHRWQDPNQAFRLLVLARACAGRGRNDLAHELCELAVREQSPLREGQAAPPGRFDRLRRDMAAEARLVVLRRLADPKRYAWTEVLDGVRWWLRAFPDAEKVEEMRGEAATLERIVAESRELPARVPAASVEAAIARLLLEVRESSIEHWNSWTPDRESAADDAMEALVAIGTPAVPALIAALEDRSFTRGWLMFNTGHGQWRHDGWPYRVSDAAIDVLDHIAGGAFRDEWAMSFELHPPSDAVRARLAAWWRKVKEHGEAAALAEVLASGDRRVPLAAERLLRIGGADALCPLRQAIASAKEPYQAEEAVQLLDGLRDAETTRYLVELVKSDLRPRVRLGAAEVLLRRGRREGLRAMEAHWLDPPPVEMDPRVGLPADPGLGGDLLRFLVGSADAETYRLLGKQLAARTGAWRFEILSSFLSRSDLFEFTERPPGAGPRDVSQEHLTPEAAAAVEDLLGQCLGDEDDRTSVGMWFGDNRVDTRIGHVAARALDVNFPDLYAYDPRAKPLARERMRRTIEDTWRERHGRSPLPPPVERKAPDLMPTEDVERLLTRRDAAAAPEDRAAADRALDEAGLRALPAVLAAARARPPEDPRRADSEALASRLASIVTEVVVTPDSARPDEALRGLLDAAVGRPFTGERYREIVLQVVRTIRTGAPGIRCRAARDEDLTGVVLRVTVLRERLHGGLNPGSLTHEMPGGGGGSGDVDYLSRPDAWQDEAKDVDRIFGAPADEPAVATFSLVLEAE